MTPALAIEMLVWTVSNIVASNATGTLLRVVRPEYIYFWLAGSTLIALWTVRRLPPLFHPAQAGQRRGMAKSMWEGFAYARSNRLLLASFALSAVANATGSLFEAMAPVFSRDVLHVGSAGLGMLLSATAFGSLVTGALLATVGASVKRVGLAVLIAAFAVHGLTIAWSFATQFSVSVGILAVAGLFTVLHGTMNTKLMLDAAPDEMRGRVQGIQFLMVGFYPISSLIVGWLADIAGPGPSVRYMALFGVGTLLLLTLAFPELRRRPPEEAKAQTVLDREGSEKPTPTESRTKKDNAALETLHAINQASKDEGPRTAAPGTMKKVAWKKVKEGFTKLEEQFAKSAASQRDSAAKNSELDQKLQQAHAFDKQPLENQIK